MNEALVYAVAPAAIAFAAIAILRRTRWAGRLADHPNQRSLHATPIPRVGGIGVMLASLPLAALAGGGALDTILACAAALAVVSLIDDVRSLPVALRLLAHLAAASIAVAVIAAPAQYPAGLLGTALTALALAWMTNLFNFMDGSDGLAGGMAAIGFGAYAIAAHGAPLGLCAAALASAAIGFLAHNFPPARVFLGDAGSVPLGFLAAALGAHGALQGAWPWWFPPLVFSPFIVDASVTLVRRLAARERIWIAHRTHYYQRLVLSGWSRRRLAACAYALMLAAAASGLAAMRSGAAGRWAILLGWAFFYVLLLFLIDRRSPRERARS